MSLRKGTSADPARRPRRTAALVFLMVLLAGMALWQQLARRGSLEQQGEFERVVDQATLSIAQQTGLYRNALLGLRAAFRASDELDAREFALYVDALQIDRNLSGLRAFALNRDLAADALPQHLDWVRQHLPPLDPAYRSYVVTPPGERAHYHLVALIRPAEGNNRSLGFDLWHDDVRREAITRARRDGFAATPPIRLRQEPSSLSVLMLAPVNARGAQHGGPEHDTVAASFRAADMVDAALSETLRRRFVLRIEDHGEPPQSSAGGLLLYQEPHAPGDPPHDTLGPPLVRELEFGGRVWQLQFRPVYPPGSQDERLAALLLIASLALLSAAVAYLVVQRRQRATRIAALARLASDCVFGLDRDGVVRHASAAAQRITGHARGDWLDRPLCAGAREEDRERVAAAVQLARAGREPVSVEFRTPDGRAGGRWVSARIGNHLDDPQIGQLLVQLSDIDARKQGEETIARMAFFDPLTNLPNRRLLDERARLTLETAHRTGGQAALLVLDLDGFKAVNDQAGHAVGDEVLRTVAARLPAAIRENDTAARLGGDEFVVLLAAPDGEAEACAAARRIAAALLEPVSAAGRSWQLTASIGIALYPDHGERLEELLRAADEAMYRIKHRGRDGYALAGDEPWDKRD